MTARKHPRALLATAIAGAALVIAMIATSAEAALRHVDGTVLSKDASTRTFRIATQGGNRIRIRVDSSTRFEGVGGFGGLRKGLAIEVEAASSGKGLLAKHVEPRQSAGGDDDNGGGGGGSGGGGQDDGPNHT
jgi:hypothetical protein